MSVTQSPATRSSTTRPPATQFPAGRRASRQVPHDPGPRLSAACDCLDRARLALAAARRDSDVNRRYAGAHVAALRTTAAVLAVRTRPGAPRGRRNAWDLLVDVAPELGEWAQFFAAGAPKRAAAEAGSTGAVTAREADDLVRQVETFIAVVEDSLGLVRGSLAAG